MPSDHTRTPTYSARLMMPVLRVLEGRPGIDTAQLSQLLAIDPDQRIPISHADKMLVSLIQVTGISTLALEAGREMQPGEAGALDYALSTAATLREAIGLVGEYMHLVSDAFDATLEVEGESARLCVGSAIPISPEQADFRMASFFADHARFWCRDPNDLTIWLSRSQPADSTAYERAFAPSKVRFGRPSDAFEFPSALLDQPLAGTDPRLHAVILRHLDHLAADLPKGETISELVTNWLRDALPKGLGDSVHAAAHLGISVRTLSRKLEREGTSFKALLDNLRRQLAFLHLSRRELSIAQIAKFLGFSEVATFHRAFKRWSEKTPYGYRTAVSDAALARKQKA